jgi:hypothetical protein
MPFSGVGLPAFVAVATGPGKLLRSADVLVHKEAEFAKHDATLYARSRFVGYDVENAVVDHLQKEAGLRPSERVYVLGDASVFYILLNVPAPYLSNSYNDSPVYEQQRIVDWLRTEHPRFVIWPTDRLVWDEVPHVVRLPLIYNYVVEHYGFTKAIGPYHVLAERTAGQGIDLDYWRRVLGDGVELGHVAQVARASEYEGCGADVSGCDAVLVVRYAETGGRRKVNVSIQSEAGPFRIGFEVVPEDREYVVNLNRLWFWSAIAKSARITVEDPAAQASTTWRRERGAVLF